jgi:hypothetical protein
VFRAFAERLAGSPLSLSLRNAPLSVGLWVGFLT